MKTENIAGPLPAANKFAWARGLLAWALTWLLLSPLIINGYFAVFLQNNPPSFASKRFALFWLGVAPLLALVFLYSLYSTLAGRDRLGIVRAALAARDRAPFALRLALGIAAVLLPGYLFQYTRAIGGLSFGYWARLSAVLVGALAAALLIYPRVSPAGFAFRYAGLVLAAGAFFTAGSWLNQVTSYPFSLGWSEGNRFWDYSVLFAGNRYSLYPDISLARPYISIGRQILWALPFLLPRTTIWAMRLWDALIWILVPAALGLAVVVGLPGGWKSWAWKALFVFWTFLFLSQGPIYAPLVVCAVVVVLAARWKWTPGSAVLVALAGYYAYLSRWTWMYAPGLWAGMLALLDLKNPSLRPARWKELVRPVALGLAGYAGAQFLQPLLTSMVKGQATGAISLVVDTTTYVNRQPLLWERLWPNVTFPPGILLGTLWAALPVLALLVWLYARRVWRPNLLQTLAAGAIALAFLGVGMVASVKIGGGSNLHNLDMFWITLALLAAWALRQLARQGWDALPKGAVLTALVCLAMLGPVTYTVKYGQPLSLPKRGYVNESLSLIRQEVDKATKRGRVLFIDNRQLLAFGLVQGVPLDPAWEKKRMMDEAMADNAKYFEQFQKDMAAHRYALIVVEPVYTGLKDTDTNSFGEENNAWVKWVSTPMLENYTTYMKFDPVGVSLLVPK